MSAQIEGFHHVKLPVRDLARSREWYERVLGLEVEREFTDDDGVVRGVAGSVGGAPIALRVQEKAAAGLAGFDPVCFALADRGRRRRVDRAPGRARRRAPAARRGEHRLDGRVADPDGTEIRLYSRVK
ncbi:VOC family protein [Amycolatopsis sp. NBC_01488]|uniref:VOC family protein n=1 Tax=Amycolatopsis sp. NBC_01488 TaxID=2903563 RepID=UPI002E2A5870|nr:VOC family protein [Amycolatopsis sp. NBC_01488]